MSARVAAVVRGIERALAAEVDPASAASQKAYMKSALRFHGVSAATIRRVARDVDRGEPDLDRDALRAIVRGLFDTEWFDLRSVGVVLLDRRSRLLAPRDFPFLIGLVREASCWAHVDELAAHVIGDVMERAPASRDSVRAWAKDPSFWVRRTALLAMLRPMRRGGGDFALWTGIAVPMLGDKEFFVRKALGWVLRDVSKKRPAPVVAFLRAHGAACSGLTLREATKYLPAAERARHVPAKTSGRTP